MGDVLAELADGDGVGFVATWLVAGEAIADEEADADDDDDSAAAVTIFSTENDENEEVTATPGVEEDDDSADFRGASLACGLRCSELSWLWCVF